MMNKLLKFLLASICLAGLFLSALAWGATTNVNMIGNRFVPPDLTISFGDKVTWRNLDRTRHDTVSGVNLVPSGIWKSQLFGIGGSFTFTYTNTPLGVKIPYYCTPHVFVGMVGSITVLPAPPTIDSPANGASFTSGDTLVIRVTAPDSNGIVARVDFYSNDGFICSVTNSPSITNSIYSVTLTNIAQGNYALSAVAVNNQGVSSMPAVVNIAVGPAEAPIIISQPEKQISRVGGTVEFVVVATGRPPPQYQWQFNGNEIPDATNATYLISNVRSIDEGNYSVVVSNRVASINSQPAALELDSMLPTISITNSPPDFTRTNSPFVFLVGNASDDRGLEHVEVQVNSGPFLSDEGTSKSADGTTNWSATVTLLPGNNAVRVRSVDLAGNISPEAVRFFTYIVNGQLIVTNTGLGTVTPDLTRSPLKIGQLYTIKAVPAFGNIFSGWDFGGLTGVGNSNNATLSFVMQSNLILTANFIPNPFATVNGTYTGLFYDHDTNAIAPESSGFFTLRVGRFGAFTGTLSSDGGGYPFRGQFNNQGQATVPVLRRQLGPVFLTLNLDLTGGTDQVHGEVSHELWSAELLGNRNPYQFRFHSASQTGLHSFVLQRDGNSMVVTNAVANINPSGGVRIRGSLTDGRKFSLATSLAQNGDCPFYISLRRGSEAMVGWLHFPIDPTPSVDRNLSWVKSGTNGFLFQLEVVPKP